jgi:PEP-CTERM/exosortase A-associated glycosyltransferase
MRVLHVLDHSLPLHSGYTFRTLALLREQRALGWETWQLTSPKHTAGGESQDETVDGWHFFRTPTSPLRLPLPVVNEVALMYRLAARMVEVVREVRPDLIHAHSPVLNALPAIKVAHHLGIPVVYEVRAFWEDAAVDHGTTSEGSLRYRLSRALETRALRRVDHIFTICEGLRRDITARAIPASRVTVIPNAVDTEVFGLQGRPDELLKSRLGLAGAEIVGFIGSFYAYEGLDLLLQALPRLLQQRPAARVLLVGGGPQAQALQEQARMLGVADKVVFAGRVPHDEVQRYYDLVDVLAYPRHSMRLTDLVTPLKPLEAMAQGKLLVASDVGGHRELIRHGETGWLFGAGQVDALADLLACVLAAPELAPGVRAAGRRYVEAERTWRGSVARYAPIYEDLVSSRRSRAATERIIA